jgi:hypothetical protein
MSTAGQGRQNPPWWAALPPASVRVPCGSGTHQLRWEQGALVAADHPDAEAELVLAALGGDRAECIGLTEAWGGRSDDLEVLAVGPRSAADELTITRDEIDQLRLAGSGLPGFGGRGRMLVAGRGGMVSAGRSATVSAGRAGPVAAGRGWPGSGPAAHAWRLVRGRYIGLLRAGPARGYAAYGVAGSRSSSSLIRAVGSAGATMRSHSVLSYGPGNETDRARARQAELLSLLTLSPALALRLTGTVAAAWADSERRPGDRAAARPALTAALAGRLAPAARSWLGIDPGQVEVTLHEDADWGQLSMTGSGRDRKLRAALPAGWLASVWAAGLAVAGGHLIVAVQEAAWPEATVLGVPEPGAEPVILKVHAAGGRWAVGAAASERVAEGKHAADGKRTADGERAADSEDATDGEQAGAGPDGSEHDDGTA